MRGLRKGRTRPGGKDEKLEREGRNFSGTIDSRHDLEEWAGVGQGKTDLATKQRKEEAGMEPKKMRGLKARNSNPPRPREKGPQKRRTKNKSSRGAKIRKEKPAKSGDIKDRHFRSKALRVTRKIGAHREMGKKWKKSKSVLKTQEARIADGNKG